MEGIKNIQPESMEQPSYKLDMTIYRHGPKTKLDGPLSEEGKDETRDFFQDAYQGIVMDSDGVDVEYSPIHRTVETAQIYSESISTIGHGDVNSSRMDERLSEGGLAENRKVLDGLIDKYGENGKWIKGWLEMEERPTESIKTGTEAVADLSSWILEKISNISEKGGKQKIAAFSHAPVMAAFFVKLQERLGVDILPDDWEEGNVFAGSLNYLSSATLVADSENLEFISLYFKGTKTEIPIEVLEEFAKLR